MSSSVKGIDRNNIQKNNLKAILFSCCYSAARSVGYLDCIPDLMT